jgi:hypothetical protein
MITKRQLFDMEACIKERKDSKHEFINKRDVKLHAILKIAGAPQELSRFQTRVVLNEVATGKPLDKALTRALSIVDKRQLAK